MSESTAGLYRSLCVLPAGELSSLGARLVETVWSRAAAGAGAQQAARPTSSAGALVATDLVSGAAPVEQAAFRNALRFAEQQSSRGGAEQACAAAPVFAATALAEARKADFGTLFHAVGLGTEAYSRLAASLAHGTQRKAFDARVIAATLASIAACAYIEKLTPEQAAQALGLGSSAVTSMAQGNLPLQVATAARDGIVMALLMRCGFRGPPDPLACRWGVYDTFGDAADVSTLDVTAARMRAGETIESAFGISPARLSVNAPLHAAVSTMQLVGSAPG